MVPHRGTNWAALWLTAQIGRDAVLSESYGRGYQYCTSADYMRPFGPPVSLRPPLAHKSNWTGPKASGR